MGSRFQRAGALGGRHCASDLQKAIARQTIRCTRPWERREYVASVVLSISPDIEAIEALYLKHGFKALATVSILNEGCRVTVTVEQRRDFDADQIEAITQILESFKNG